MKPVSRHPVNKHRSAKQFGHHTRTVAAANMQIGPYARWLASVNALLPSDAGCPDV